MNRTNLIAAAVVVLGVLACNRSRTDDSRVGDASTTGATVTPDNDRSGGVSSSAGTMATHDGGHIGTMGKDASASEPRGSNRMTDTGSAADRDRNLGITRDGGGMMEPAPNEPAPRQPSGGADYNR